MKTLNTAIRRMISSLSVFLFAVLSFAQEKETDININVNKGGGAWYTSPVVWVIGAAVFILLPVALLRGNRSR